MELWERHTKARNHLLFTAGPLIDLKWAVDKVVVHHGTRRRVTTRAFALIEGFLPQHPYVSIHFNTSKQPTDPIDYRDLDAQGMSIQMALDAINIPNSISMVEINPRFDVHRDILFKYYNERRLIELGNGKNPSPVTEKILTDVRAFQKFLNRTFQPGQDDISLNSKDAIYQLDGGIIVRPAHEQFMRFEWKLPSQRGERLIQKALEHEWTKTGQVFGVCLRDLEGRNLYQMHSSREMVASHPKMEAPETWRVVCKSPRGRPPHIHTKGVSIRSKMSVLANLDVGGFPCEGERNLVQSFAWSTVHNNGIVLFYGPEVALVRFRNSATESEPKDTAPQRKPIVHSTWAQAPKPTSLEVRTPSHERAFHAQVVAGLFGPFRKCRRATDPNNTGNVFQAEYIDEESSILAIWEVLTSSAHSPMN